MKDFFKKIRHTPTLNDSTINTRKQAIYNTIDVKSSKTKIKKGNELINLSNKGKENIIQSYGLIKMKPIIKIDKWTAAKVVRFINYNTKQHKMEITPIIKYSIQDSKFNSKTYEFEIIENVPKEFKNSRIIIKNIINASQAEKELNIMNNLNNLKKHKVIKFNLTNFYGIAFEHCNQRTLKYHLDEFKDNQDSLYSILFNEYDNCKKNILQLFEGVKYINNMDYIHNALNPNNILIHDTGDTSDTGDNRYILKITSFEIAEHVTQEKFPFKTDNIRLYYLPHMSPNSVKLPKQDNALSKSKKKSNLGMRSTKKRGGSRPPAYNLEIQTNNDIWALGCIISEIFNVKKNLILPPYTKTEEVVINHLTKSWRSDTIPNKLNDYEQNFKDLFMNKSVEIDARCANLYKYLGFNLLINTPKNLNNLINELKSDEDIDLKLIPLNMEKIENMLK